MKRTAVAVAVVVATLVSPVSPAGATTPSGLLPRISALEVATRADKATAAINRKDLADSLINLLTKAQQKAAAGDTSGAQTLLDSFTSSVQANYGTRIYFVAADKLLELANGSIEPDVTTVTPGQAATVTADLGDAQLSVSIPAGTNIGIVDIDAPTVPRQLTPPVAQQLLGSAVVRAYDKNGVPVTVPKSPLTLMFTVPGADWTVSDRAELDTVDPKTLKTQRLSSQVTGTADSVTVTAQTAHLSPFSVDAPSSSDVINNFAGSAGEGQGRDVSQSPGPIVAHDGAVYIGDTDQHVVRALDPVTGRETIAVGAGGQGAPDFGDGGPAHEAGIGTPNALAFDTVGNLYIADSTSNRIRKVDTDGIITTIAGTGTPGDNGDERTAVSAQLSYPTGVAVDGAGNVWIADHNNHRLRRIDSGGIIHAVPGISGDPYSVVAGGVVYVDVQRTSPSYANVVYRVPTSGTPTELRSDPQFDFLESIALDDSGHLLINKCISNVVRSLDLDTLQEAVIAGTGEAGFAGDGHLATTAKLYCPEATTVDADGAMYIADTGNLRVRRVDYAGLIWTVAGDGQSRSSGDGGAATSAEFADAQQVAADPFGNVFITDYGNNSIRKVDATGTISTFVSKLGSLGGIAVDGNGNLFVGETFDDGTGKILKVKPDRSVSTFVPGIVWPTSLAFDPSGNLIVADNYSNAVLRVTPAATVTTVATGFVTPDAVAVDDSGVIYVADAYDHRVLEIDGTGNVTPFAGTGVAGDSGDGGPAASAQLERPVALAVDPDGRVLIGDLDVPRVRAVDPSTGVITTVVGNGLYGHGGDGGTALQARVNGVGGLAFDPAGNLYLVDASAECVRRVEA